MFELQPKLKSDGHTSDGRTNEYIASRLLKSEDYIPAWLAGKQLSRSRDERVSLGGFSSRGAGLELPSKNVLYCSLIFAHSKQGDGEERRVSSERSG